MINKKKHSFNIIDVLLIVLILASVAAVTIFFMMRSSTGESTPVKLTVTVLLADRTAEEAKAVSVGDVVSNGLSDEVFGTVVGVKKENALKYTIPASPDTVMKADRSPLRYDVTVTIEIDGYRDTNGLSYYTAFFSNTRRVAVGLKYSLYKVDGTAVGTGFCTSLVREEA